MRALLALPLLLSLAACGGLHREWEKPGSERETARLDLNGCRRAAATESLRYRADLSLPRPGSYYGRADYYQARFDVDRFGNEQRLTAFCMRNKGYELTVMPTDIRPATPPPLPRSP